MSSVYPKGSVLYFRVKVDGKWIGVPTDFKVGQEREAKKLLAKLDARTAAGEALDDGAFGPVTVHRVEKKWIAAREREVPSWKNDESVMRLHVLPVLGDKLIDEVTASDVLSLVKGWRARTGEERMAPRSIYTAYSTVCAFFRDAAIDGLISTTPCMLTKRQLGAKVDKNPEWRQGAQFGRAELEALISDTRISLDRRVLYAMLGVAGVRFGEAAGMLFRNVAADPDLEPAPMLYVAYSYERPLPKGEVCRPVPMHPVLRALLAEWKLSGWKAMFKRAPTGDDLVVPLPPGTKTKKGPWRRKSRIYRDLMKDLELLGFRHRRGHDLRRTMISLSRSDGAQVDILRRATHKPPKEVVDGYTTFEWDVVCREVLKLKVQLRRTANPLRLTPRATGRATAGGEAMELAEESAEENPVRVRGAPHETNPEHPGSSAQDRETASTGHRSTPAPPPETSASGSNGSKRRWVPPALRRVSAREALKLLGGAR